MSNRRPLRTPAALRLNMLQRGIAPRARGILLTPNISERYVTMDHTKDSVSSILSGSNKNNQATAMLAWANPNPPDEKTRTARLRASRRLRRKPRREKVVKLLNTNDTGIRDEAGLKLLQPLGANPCPSGDLSSRERASAQQLEGSVKERLGHALSLGKTLPMSSSGVRTQSETLYPDWSVIFSRMKAETAVEVVAVLTANLDQLQAKYDLSDAEIAKAHNEVSIKTVNNARRSRHKKMTISTISALAHGLGLEAWQLLVEKVSELEPKDQHLLAAVVRAFVRLGSEARGSLVRTAENEAKGQHKVQEIFGVPLPKAATSR